MTREEILALPAGPETDRLVAERVMGIGWQGGNPIDGYDGRWPWPPPYSTDVAAAWSVVEKLTDNQDGYCFDLYRGTFPDQPPEWVCATLRGRGMVVACGQTAPLAVCRAALLATPTD